MSEEISELNKKEQQIIRAKDLLESLEFQNAISSWWYLYTQVQNHRPQRTK